MKRALAVAVLTAGLLACHDFDRAYDECVAAGTCQPPAGTGSLVLDPPEALVLQTVRGEPVSAPFVVRNLGTVELSALAVGEPQDPGVFFRTTDCGASLAPGSECRGTVTFFTDAGASVDSALRVGSLETGELSLLLQGRVLPRLTAAPERHHFGLVYEGEAAGPVEVVVTNNSPLTTTAPLVGSVPRLIISLVPFPITAAPQYEVDAGTCTGALPPLSQCTLSVQARPTQIEVPALQRLTVQGRSDAGVLDEVVKIELEMQPLRVGTLRFNTTLLSPQEADAGVYFTRQYKLSNTSRSDATGPVAFSWVDDAGIVAGLDAGACLGPLMPQAECTFDITLGAQVGGLFEAQLLAQATPGGTAVMRFPLRVIDLVPLDVSVSDGGSVFSDAGLDCPGQCGAMVRRFKRVTLEARPAAGFELERWGGACADAGPGNCALFPDGGVTVEGWFRPL